MSAIDAFYSTWSQARDTFGSGVPQDGSEFDKSSQLRQLQSSVQAAAPDSRWQGPAADAYAAKNQQHAATYGKLAELDQRMAAEVSKTAGVVTAGRQNLERLHDWVTSAAASTPNDRSGEAMKVAIASKGIGQISEIIQQSNDQMNAIGENIRKIGREYDEIGGEKEGDSGDEPMNLTEDDKRDEALPETTLDLSDIKQLPPYDPQDPSTFGPPGYRELVPGSGTWVPDPKSPLYRPTPVKAPLDLKDIVYLPPYVPGDESTYGPYGYTELVPGSGTWVPTPGGPMWPKDAPVAPVDLAEIEYRQPFVSGDETTYGPYGYTELVPNGGAWVPDPRVGTAR